jgi:exodeoxyribonuclease V beta subunit
MSADYPPLDPLTFPLDGLRLIEASAGTGKTYAIANLFVRLVAEQGLGVERILVVTFTRAATEELRGRIRERLGEALTAMQDGQGDDDFLNALGRRCGEAGPQRLRAALLAMDEASIHTIHGFCQRVLTDHAFESGAGFEAELVMDDLDYRTQAMRDFWRRRCYPLAPEPAAWVHEAWGTPDALLKVLGDAFSHHRVRLLPEGQPDLDGARVLVAPLHAEAMALWRAERDAIVELLVQHKAIGHAEKTYRQDKVEAAAAELDGWLVEGASLLNPPPAVGFFSRSVLGEARTKTALKKGLGAPEHALFDLFEQIHPVTARLRRDFLVALQVEALQWVRDEIHRRKSAANVLAPDDLLLGAHRALHGPGAGGLACCVRETWPVALIDEFQDTDPLQYEIFQRVYDGAADGALVMIGDPKQAIYGFRGADLFTYLEAARNPQGRYSLDTNWRSTDRLVQAVNALFGGDAPFVLYGLMAYRPVRSAGRAEEKPLRVAGDRSAAVHLWRLRLTEENQYRGVIKADWANPSMAQACSAEIARLLNLSRAGQATLGGEPLQARNIAVLVRDRHEATRVREALWRRGIGSSFISRDSVYDSAEAHWLLALLEAVADEGAEHTLRRALAGGILGWDAEGLERLNHDEGLLEAVQERFADYARHWQRRGLAPMLTRLLHGEGVPARLLARADGERALTNLRHLGEQLQAAAAEVHGGPRGLLRWLRERMIADGDSEEAQLRLESDENLVQIVTLHKSKGLQYPVVFLPYPWRCRPVTETSWRLAFHDDRGRFTLDLGSDRFSDHVAPAERERLAEDVRLLYVALTRAEHRIYLPWGHVHGAGGSAFAYLLHGQDRTELDESIIHRRLQRLCDEHPESFALLDLPEESTSGITAPAAGRGQVEPLRFGRHLQDDWRIASYSGFIAGHQDQPERPDFDALAEAPQQEPDEDVPPQPGSRFDFPKGARAGQCLHGILETMDFQAGDSETLRELVRRQLQRQGLDPVWEDGVAAWLLQVVDTPLGESPLGESPVGEPIDQEESAVQASLPLAGGLGRGFPLSAVPAHRRIPEMGFYLPLSPLQAGDLEVLLRRYRGAPVPQLAFGRVQGMLNGFIDLVLEQGGRFYVLDYKSNYLGPDHHHYGPRAMEAAMREHLYDLQYLIYSLALHRYLGVRLPDYDFQRHFGGVRYLFLRGMDPARPGSGVYAARPDLEILLALDRLCGDRAETAP